MTKLRKIELKEDVIRVKDADGVKEVPLSYRESMINALNQPPIDDRSGQPRGFGPVEMKRRLKIVDLIESANGEVLLENSDWAELNKCVQDQKWIVIDDSIVRYSESVANAEQVEVEEKSKKKGG